MDTTYHELAARALDLLRQSRKYRILIVLVGAPGSGKSTLAQRVVDILNGYDINTVPGHCCGLAIDPSASQPGVSACADDTGTVFSAQGGCQTSFKVSKPLTGTQTQSQSQPQPPQPQLAQVIPMDGFHLPKHVLDTLPDPAQAHSRRGAPFTFDTRLIVEFIAKLKSTLSVPDNGLGQFDVIKHLLPSFDIPSFSHADQDPKRFGIHINPSTRILIMEGLYLLLNEPVWEQIPRMLKDLDSTQFWIINSTDSIVLSRVSKRHFSSGLVSSVEQGVVRCELNDLPNAQLVYSSSFQPDLVIDTVDDASEASSPPASRTS